MTEKTRKEPEQKIPVTPKCINVFHELEFQIANCDLSYEQHAEAISLFRAFKDNFALCLVEGVDIGKVDI